MNKRDAHGLVGDDDVYTINTLWGRRAETSHLITKRWMSLVERLRGIDVLFDKWQYNDEGRGFVPYIPDFGLQLARVRSEMETDTRGNIVDAAGTSLWLSNQFYNRPLEIL